MYRSLFPVCSPFPQTAFTCFHLIFYLRGLLGCPVISGSWFRGRARRWSEVLWGPSLTATWSYGPYFGETLTSVSSWLSFWPLPDFVLQVWGLATSGGVQGLLPGVLFPGKSALCPVPTTGSQEWGTIEHFDCSRLLSCLDFSPLPSFLFQVYCQFLNKATTFYYRKFKHAKKAEGGPHGIPVYPLPTANRLQSSSIPVFAGMSRAMPLFVPGDFPCSEASLPCGATAAVFWSMLTQCSFSIPVLLTWL